MKPLGWDGPDEGMYWSRSVMVARCELYYLAHGFREFRLMGQDILGSLKHK